VALQPEVHSRREFDRPTLIVYEEPENGLYARSLRSLFELISEASQYTQVIITTHSPDLMSLFDVDALRVVEMTPEGTKIGPVADWQRQAIRDRLFPPGEIMRMEGLQMAARAE
jgi:predicted ATPase